jgi:type VI secretion system protein ImpA
VEPIAQDNPCGHSLDDSQTLAALEAYRVFGRLKAAADEPNWQALRKECLDALTQSKDLRVLAYLTAAALRTEPLTSAMRIFPLIATWLEQYWAEVHPRIDDDVVARRNALMFFVDRLGMLDALRRATVVHDARFGPFSVRDFEIATGVLQVTDAEAKPVSKEVIDAALAAADPHDLRQISDSAMAAAQALPRVEALMLEKGGGYEAVPQLEGLLRILQSVQQMLGPFAAAPLQVSPEPSASSLPTAAVSPGQSAPQVGMIGSRDDVQRALDAVLGYYRNSEPGSLVPLIVERAKRLVSLNFLDALAEVAPEVVDPVKRAVGVREQSS